MNKVKCNIGEELYFFRESGCGDKINIGKWKVTKNSDKIFEITLIEEPLVFGFWSYKKGSKITCKYDNNCRHFLKVYGDYKNNFCIYPDRQGIPIFINND